MRERIRSKRHDRAHGLGFLAVAWIEHFAVHGPGDVQNRPLDPSLPGALPLDAEFAGFIADAYAHTAEGRRLYTSTFLSRAKGRAKSELAGFLVLFEALGPARVVTYPEDHPLLPGRPVLAVEGDTFTVGDFVYHYAPGDLMGRRVVYPFIRCLATEAGQAGNTYDNVYLNLGGYGEGSTRLLQTYGFTRDDVGLTRINIPGAGEIIPSTASNSAKDGGKETFVVFDETHLYVTPELHRMYRTVTQNLDKRKGSEPWALETSTMYQPGEESIAEATHKEAARIREGKSSIDHVFFDHRQADADTNVADRVSILKGLREAYGPAAAWMDLARMVDAFFDRRRPIANQRRYFLNQPTSASDAWLTGVDWGKLAQPSEVVDPRETITLGFDGSQKRARGVADATALIGCRVSDGHLFTIKVWEQPDGPDGDDWSVPVEEVKEAVQEAFSRFSVVAFYADPPFWEGVISEWEAVYTPRLKVKSTPRNAIVWWTNRTTLMGRALDRFEGAVKDRELSHDGSDVLTRHALNARRRPRREAMGIGKEHPMSRNKIDAVVAAVLAFQARADVLASGHKRRRPTRVVTARAY